MRHKLELEALSVQSFPVELPAAPVAEMRLAPSMIDRTGCYTDCRCLPTV